MAAVIHHLVLTTAPNCADWNNKIFVNGRKWGLPVAGTDKPMRDLSGVRLEVASHGVKAEDCNENKLSNAMRTFGLVSETASNNVPIRKSPAQDWSKLLDRVRSAALQVRKVEADAHEQELRVRDILQKVQEDIKSANERVLAAEANARDTQARADALLRAADDRVKAAEERARIAEEWLTQLSITIIDGFEGGRSERLIA